MDLNIPSKIGLWLAAGVPAAIFMEFWAAALHAKVWHGPLWVLHESHHAPTGFWERNDILSFTHAPIAIALILYGCLGQLGVVRELAFGVGLGMTAFGVAYTVVHDGLVHGRLPVQGLKKYGWLRRVRNAHQVHHRIDGPPYGLFSGPWAMARASRARARKAQASKAQASEVRKAGASEARQGEGTLGRH
jgi:beta-carotene 3-hydroxylase